MRRLSFLEVIHSNPQDSIYGERFDSFNEQGNSDDQIEFLNSNREPTSAEEDYIASDDILMSERISNTSMCLPISSSTVPMEITDDELRATVRSLNSKQRFAYEIILKWCRDKVKNLMSLEPFPVEPVSQVYFWWCWSRKKLSHQSPLPNGFENFQMWPI